MNNVSLSTCQEEAIMIPFLLPLIIFNWEQLMIAIYKIHIFKTMFLPVANTICSTLGGWERGRKPNQMDCFSFSILSAYSIDWSAGYENTFSQLCFFTRKLYLVDNYFYDGMGEYIHVESLCTLNSLVQEGRGIFRVAIIVKRANSALEKQMTRNKKGVYILYYKVDLRGGRKNEIILDQSEMKP